MPDALISGEADLHGLAPMHIFTEQQSGTYDRCRLGPRQRPAQVGNLSGRQMNEAEQFIDIKQHPAPARLAAQYVFDVGLEWIVVIPERNEFVTVGPGEDPQAGRHVAGDSPGPLKVSRARRDSEDCGKQRMTDFLRCLVGEFWFINEEWFAVGVYHCAKNAVPPRLSGGLKEDLEQTEFAFL